MAPQPAAQIAALDFAHASEAMDRAFAVVHRTNKSGTDAELDAAADLLTSCIKSLLAIPATTPAQIAQKVRGQAWLHADATVDLADEAERRSLFASTDKRDGDAKGLLAIYLDLTAQASATVTPALAEAIARTQEALLVFALCTDATDTVRAANEGRKVTAADRKRWTEANADVDAHLSAVRAYPFAHAADVLAKQNFLKTVWHDHDEDEARANYDALLADVRRLGGVQ